MSIVTFPAEDKSQMLVAVGGFFLSSGKGTLECFQFMKVNCSILVP